MAGRKGGANAGKPADKAGAGTERGVCIACGRELPGTPAMPDRVILLFRKMRALLRLKETHTVACRECLPECAAKRAKFEKALTNYRWAAVLFFFFVIAGSMFFGGFSLGVLVPAILGSLVVLALPYAYYFPKFQ